MPHELSENTGTKLLGHKTQHTWGAAQNTNVQLELYILHHIIFNVYTEFALANNNKNEINKFTLAQRHFGVDFRKRERDNGFFHKKYFENCNLLTK